MLFVVVVEEWTDDRLQWDPTNYGNVTDIIVKAEQIWLPELAVMNGSDTDFYILLIHSAVRV